MKNKCVWTFFKVYTSLNAVLAIGILRKRKTLDGYSMTNKTQDEIMKNWPKQCDCPMVSIRCITYNHESYIAQAIDGFLNQETNFPFDIVIHDDASTDRTADIIREYEMKYPKIIKPIYESENQYSKHNGLISRIVDEACNGKYVAMCEGDDFWIDSKKLQKQVDFLEQNPDYSLVTHRYEIITGAENRRLAANAYFEKNPEDLFYTFDTNYLFGVQFAIHTATVLYRRSCLSWMDFNNCVYRRDVHLFYTLLTRGKGVCFSFVGSVYRMNAGGLYTSHSEIQRSVVDRDMFTELYYVTKDDVFKKKLLSVYVTLFSYGAFKEIRGPLNFIKVALFLYPKYKWGFVKKRLFKAK